MSRSSAVPGRTLPPWLAAALAGVVGAAIPVQARLNGEFGATLGDPIMAAAVSFAGGLLVMAALALISPRLRRGLRALPRAVAAGTLPVYYLAAGAIGALLVLTQTTVVALVGVAVFTVSVVAGQVVSGIVIDTLGFAATQRRPPGPVRLLGAGLVLVAVALSAFAGTGVGGAGLELAASALAAFIVGGLTGFQYAMNGRTGTVGGSPLVATAVNFVAGMLLLVLVLGVRILTGTATSWTWPGQWWLYISGIVGLVYIAGLAALTPRTGVLLVGLGSVAGQLVGSLLLDVLAPVGSAGVSAATVGATALALVAIVVATVVPGRR